MANFMQLVVCNDGFLPFVRIVGGRDESIAIQESLATQNWMMSESKMEEMEEDVYWPNTEIRRGGFKRPEVDDASSTRNMCVSSHRSPAFLHQVDQPLPLLLVCWILPVIVNTIKPMLNQQLLQCPKEGSPSGLFYHHPRKAASAAVAAKAEEQLPADAIGGLSGPPHDPGRDTEGQSYLPSPVVMG